VTSDRAILLAARGLVSGTKLPMYGISSLAQRMVDAVTMGGTITTHVFKKFTDPARTGRDARPPRLVDSLHSMGLQSSAPASGIPAAAHHGSAGRPLQALVRQPRHFSRGHR